MQRNEFKYGFYHQNHACFPPKYLSILHKINKAQPALTTVNQQNFMGKSDKDNEINNSV